MKNVVAYIRVSTDNQANDDKFGLEEQKNMIIEYCAKFDMKIIKWFSDIGESGAKYRPGFDEIIYGEVVNPPVEAVIVAKSDRVARDINVYFFYQGSLLRKGIELISISEDFGQFGVFANALKSFVITCAEMERRNINQRTSGGRRIKASAGGYSGGRTPFGYKAQNHQMVINEDEADIVRDIFNLKDKKGFTYQQICDYLNNAGKTNRSGTIFSISTIQVIYGNRKVYQGMYKYGKDSNWVKGVHKPILTEEVPNDN